MQPTRKAARLENYDYASSGFYFLTICTQNRECILSRVNVGAAFGSPPAVVLTNLGRIVDREIAELGAVYPAVHVDHSVIMPNHIHLLLTIAPDSGRPQAAPTVGRVVNQFKGAVTKKAGKPVWQKGFHDHIIRDERDYLLHLQYIEGNPQKWLLGKDEY